MNKNSVLLLGGNYFPEPTGIGKYNAELMEWLVMNNYECGVVTTYPYYPYWKIQKPYVNKSAWYKREQKKVTEQKTVTIYRCPHYVPSIPTGLKRVLSDVSFFLSAFFQVVRLLFRKKYNYVLVVSPPFQIGLLGYLYKKLRGAKLIYHVQDLQIDAAVELGMIKSKKMVNVMFGIEKFILRKADFVSSISDGMIKKIRAKFDRPVLLFPNWADIGAFFPIASKDALKKEFEFLSTDKVVLYSGAIGEKQGLQSLLHTASDLRAFKFLKFVICGSGPYKDTLVEMANSLGLENVRFMPLQPTNKFNNFLNMADVHLILQKANEKELFLPSKLTTICAVGGLAVITAPKKTSLFDLVENNNLGILIAPENQAALTEAIKSAIYHDHSVMQKSARKFAIEFLSIDKIVAGYFSIVNPTEKAAEFTLQNELVTEANTLANRYFPLNTEAGVGE